MRVLVQDVSFLLVCFKSLKYCCFLNYVLINTRLYVPWLLLCWIFHLSLFVKRRLVPLATRKLLAFTRGGAATEVQGKSRQKPWFCHLLDFSGELVRFCVQSLQRSPFSSLSNHVSRT